MQFPKPYERTHHVVENKGKPLCYPTMLLKTSGLAASSHDVVENRSFNVISRRPERLRFQRRTKKHPNEPTRLLKIEEGIF
jgi:hypothetical protein